MALRRHKVHKGINYLLNPLRRRVAARNITVVFAVK